MAAAIFDALPAPPIAAKPMQQGSCPNCGTTLSAEIEVEEAQRRIHELEAQVEMLKEKATAAGTFDAYWA